MEGSHSVLSLIGALIEARTGGPFRPHSVHGRREHHLLSPGTSRRVTDTHSVDGHPARINSELNNNEPDRADGGHTSSADAVGHQDNSTAPVMPLGSGDNAERAHHFTSPIDHAFPNNNTTRHSIQEQLLQQLTRAGVMNTNPPEEPIKAEPVAVQPYTVRQSRDCFSPLSPLDHSKTTHLQDVPGPSNSIHSDREGSPQSLNDKCHYRWR